MNVTSRWLRPEHRRVRALPEGRAGGAEAQSWPDLPPGCEPFLTLTTASVIVNSPDDGTLGARLGDVRNMLDEAVSKLAPDDPHLPQVDIQRAMLLHRLAARGQDTTALAAAAAEIGGTMPQFSRQGAGSESAVLAGLLGGASTVLGSLWRMKDAGTAVLMFMVHHYLSRGIRPVDALNRAQLWMLNSERRIPASMPAALRDTLPGLDLTDPVGWASLSHQGH